MAFVCRSPRTTDDGSRGKIVRGRHIAAAKTPYDRPAASASTQPRNPNWLTGVIFSNSRMIASGATKLLSSVFGPDTSSSSSSSGTDSSSDDGMDDENDDHDVPSDNIVGLHKNETASESIECFMADSQLTVRKSEIKPVIEKLLMQETYSRKECERLIKIINSRVIDGCTMEEGHDGKLGDIASRTVGDVTPELCSKAVMEARQWLEERKVASSSKSDLDHGICTLNSVALSHAVTKGEFVSPVDIAKVYMGARPPWTSPSVNYVEAGIPSPIGREPLKDETSYSVADNSLSSSKKIYSLSCGSWNIHEEIRRLRSKATEDMLKTISSTSWERGDTVRNSNLFPSTKLIDASLELPVGVGTCHDLPASALELNGNSSRDDEMSSQPIIFPALNRDLEAVRAVEGERLADSSSCNPTIPYIALEHDSRMSDPAYSPDKEETRVNPDTNGFPTSGSSFAAGDDKQYLNSVPVEEACKLLSEASMEVPVVNETNNSAVAAAAATAGVCRNSPTTQCEELTQPNLEDSLMEKPKSMVEKQPGRKPSSRYNRKSRGKG